MYDKNYSYEVNQELNKVTTIYDEVAEIWERKGYEVDFTEHPFASMECTKDYERFMFYLDKKRWWAQERFELFEEALTITIEHMDLITETGQILGWWK